MLHTACSPCVYLLCIQVNFCAEEFTHAMLCKCVCFIQSVLCYECSCFLCTLYAMCLCMRACVCAFACLHWRNISFLHCRCGYCSADRYTSSSYIFLLFLLSDLPTWMALTGTLCCTARFRTPSPSPSLRNGCIGRIGITSQSRRQTDSRARTARHWATTHIAPWTSISTTPSYNLLVWH